MNRSGIQGRGSCAVTDERTVIVLAAGEGKRMKSATPKVLHPMLGRTLLGPRPGRRRGAAARPARGRGGPERAEPDRPHRRGRAGRGRGGAGGAARHRPRRPGRGRGGRDRRRHGRGRVRRHPAAAGRRRWPAWSRRTRRPGRRRPILTAELDEPFGLGRILRNADGRGRGDRGGARTRPRRSARSPRSTPACTRSTRRLLGPALGKLTTQNAQGEEYLTDVVGVLVDSGRTVIAYPAADRAEVLGLQRPGPARRPCGRSCGTGSTRPGSWPASPSSTRPPPGST